MTYKTEALPFFAPITKNSHEDERLGWLGRVAEKAFNFNGHQVKVLEKIDGVEGLPVQYRKKVKKDNLFFTVLKIVALASVLFPITIALFAIKCLYRILNKPVLVEKNSVPLPGVISAITNPVQTDPVQSDQVKSQNNKGESKTKILVKDIASVEPPNEDSDVEASNTQLASKDIALSEPTPEHHDDIGSLDDLKNAAESLGDLNLDNLEAENSPAQIAKERDYKLDVDPEKVKDRLSRKIKLDKAAIFKNKKKACEIETEILKVGSYPIAVASTKGTKYLFMEDAHLATEFMFTPEDGKEHVVQFFGVFDGHMGGKCSKYVQKHIVEYIKNEFSSMKELNDLNLWNALKIAFVKLNDAWKDSGKNNDDGSTACVILIIEDAIISVNVGDSRAVLWDGENAVQITKDQKADDITLYNSIHKRGGSVTHGRVDGLAVARAFGDKWVEGITARPKLHKELLHKQSSGEIELTPAAANKKNEKFIVIGSDGLWDAVGSEEAVTLEEGMIPALYSTKLVEKAVSQGSIDNITAMVVKLN